MNMTWHTSAVVHRQVDGVKPLATPDDCFEAEEICKADAEVRSSTTCKTPRLGSPFSVVSHCTFCADFTPPKQAVSGVG